MVKQGQIIWTDFDPQIGHEQKGRHPALVVSNKSFNGFSRFLVICPITNNDKNHPFDVRLDYRTKTTGVVMCDQVKALDVSARKFTIVEKAPDDILSIVLDILSGFIEYDDDN